MLKFNRYLFNSFFIKSVSCDKNNNIYFCTKEEINRNNILSLTRLVRQLN